jgi:AraC-like DNA-binding protein
MAALNKPATYQPEDAVGMPIRWYLWDGGFLAIGRAGGEVPVHAHHAIQLFLAIEGKGAIRPAGGEWREARGMIVRPDAEHSFNANGAFGAMLFVDPESSEGAWLQTVLVDDITLVPEARLEPCLAELRAFRERPLESKPVGELIRHCVLTFCAGAPPSRRLDERVTRVLKAIRESDEMKMPLEAAAALVHLSPGRFAHLFKEQVGLPFRRYILWRKLARAMLAIGRERTLAAAAHASDFADAAHLTRTFYQMFGIPPSVMMRGEFFEIPSPFASPG